MTVQARVGGADDEGSFELDLIEPPRCSGCEGRCIWRWAPVSSLRVRSELDLQPGEIVTISLRRQLLLHGALALHGLPWGGLLLGAAAGALIQGGDLGTVVGAVAGLGGGLLAGRRLQRARRIAPDLIRAPVS